MKPLMLGLGAALVAMLGVPERGQAQVPVVLVCEDGTTQPGSSRVSCADHGGMDWETTKAWSEMRAGRFTKIDTVVCTDGQARAAGRLACRDHGGVDSVSTLAAVKRRADAYRYADAPAKSVESRDAEKASGSDSTKWGHQVNQDPAVQNPAGYRGMERPVGTFPADSAAAADSVASAGATSRVGQMQRQDTLESNADQNPPGYRGMERPQADTASGGAMTADSAARQAMTQDSVAADTAAAEDPAQQ